MSASGIATAAEREQEIGPLAYLPALAGDYSTLDSEETDSRYHIFVRLPEGYEDKPKQSWPVVYLLDGDSTFPMLAPQHLFLHYDEGLPEAILVGIAYGGFGAINRRGHDFRPVLEGGGAGGSSAFLAMLEGELIPRIEGAFRTDPAKRILVGQSRGGSFVLYAAVERPELFYGYIASNPGREYPDRKLYGMGRAMLEVRTEGLLVLASGSRDRDYLRGTALEWAETFAKRTDLPWRAQFLDIQGGTHAASLPEVYRRAMLKILPPPSEE
ncbi:MAG: alpha/beta hydrolase-fold protein [Pseudomonadota bacterium]